MEITLGHTYRWHATTENAKKKTKKQYNTGVCVWRGGGEWLPACNAESPSEAFNYQMFQLMFVLYELE